MEFFGGVHIDSMRGADWYRYEATREWGVASIQDNFHYYQGEIDSALNDSETYHDPDYVAARARRDTPFAFRWYVGRQRGRGMVLWVVSWESC